ncbi:MAG: polysaccharide biosynthesis C-terminal domain-containing protein, partial [Oscillospiraceae bacterium]|nr:polysaccharide biosynthesis C-terminal domain-containing protein [Oscillospiraceae bacterium]
LGAALTAALEPAGGSFLYLLLGNAVTDTAVCAVFYIKYKGLFRFGRRHFSKPMFRRFISYGAPFIVINMTTSLLNLSDRYIIAFLSPTGDGDAMAGVYMANYQVISSAFLAISVGILRGVYPRAMASWKGSDTKAAAEAMSSGVRYYLLVAVPALVGIATLAESVSSVFLAARNARYAEGWPVMVLAAAGLFFLGLADYRNKGCELKGRTKPILYINMACAAFNLTFNLIAVPIYGFMAAAVSTFLSYLLYFLLAGLINRGILRWEVPLASVIRILSSAAAMGVAVFAVDRTVGRGVATLAATVAVGVAVYAAALIATGEVRGELRRLLGRPKA